jgi:hypothetical protein
LRRFLAVVLTAALMMGCGGAANSSRPYPAANGAATTARSQPAAAAASPSTRAQDALGQLTLAQADVPPELQLSGKRPFTNKDYAAMESDPTAFQKQLDDAGRLDGSFVQFLNNATATPPPNTPIMLGVIDIVSVWRDADAAKAGLPTTLAAVQPVSSMPNSIQVETSDVDLGNIGDEVTAKRLHATSLVPGQVGGDAYVVGLRRGAKTALVIVTGANGAPTPDQVRQLTERQNQRLG